MLRSVKYGLNGAVLAGLIAAPVAWKAVDKSVDLVVDGHARTVHTTASDVSAVLTAQGYDVDRHDLVAPSLHSSLSDGSKVVLRRGRLLHLSVDGAPKDVWTTAPTVSAALGELGYTRQDFVSVSRSRRLPLSPSAMTIRTPRTVTLVHDGTRNQVTTTDATVGSLLSDMKITVGPNDRLSSTPGALLASGQTITLQRVVRKIEQHTKKLDYDVKHHDDPKLATGKTKTVRKGQTGTKQITYAVVFVDGKSMGRMKVDEKVLEQPVAKVVNVGTKPVKSPNADSTAPNTPNAPAPSPGSAKAIAKELLAKRGYGENQYSCLVQMWDRESGWDTHAANPSGAYGIPQALPGSKMASAGPDWENNATTQIKWGIGYTVERYGSPCDAWSYWQGHGYY